MFCYCAESRRAARLLTARYDRHLVPAGLTAAQFEVLNVIAARQQVNGRALADALAVDPTTLSRNLKVLCEAGTVKAGRSQEDARQTLYSLTGKGSARLEKAKPLWQQAHAETLQGLASSRTEVRTALLSLTAALHP